MHATLFSWSARRCALVVVYLDVSAHASPSADYFPRVAKLLEAEKEISEKEKLKILFVLTLF